MGIKSVLAVWAVIILLLSWSFAHVVIGPSGY